MKILHIISQRPDSTGSGIYLRQLVARAAAAGHENYLVCGLGPHDTAELDGIDAIDIHAVRFESVDEPGRIVGMSDAMPYPSRTFRSLDGDALRIYRANFSTAITGAVERCKPDIIHTHHLWIVTALTRKLVPDIPTLTSCHGSDLRQFVQCPDLRPFVSAGCARVNRVCALSPSQKEQIARTYPIEPDRIVVTGAGFDEEIFYPRSSLRGDAETPIPILYTGKLSRAKGVIWLLWALESLAHLPFHLHLAGSGHGPEYQACVQAAAPLGTRVTFHGSLPQRELAALMRRCDLLVLPSLSEGLPLVILEALACGCRIVATDLPGVREIAARIGCSDDCSNDSLDGPLLQMVPTPTVTDLDATTLDDEQRFVANLRGALLPFLSAPPSPPGQPRPTPRLDYFTWASVFARIEPIWEELAVAQNR